MRACAGDGGQAGPLGVHGVDAGSCVQAGSIPSHPALTSYSLAGTLAHTRLHATDVLLAHMLILHARTHGDWVVQPLGHAVLKPTVYVVHPPSLCGSSSQCRCILPASFIHALVLYLHCAVQYCGAAVL